MKSAGSSGHFISTAVTNASSFHTLELNYEEIIIHLYYINLYYIIYVYIFESNICIVYI